MQTDVIFGASLVLIFKYLLVQTFRPIYECSNV